MLPKVEYQDWPNLSYQKAWDYQYTLQRALIDNKLKVKADFAADTPSVSEADTFENRLIAAQKHYLLFCEHNHVYTLGKSGSVEHLLLNESQLAERNIEFFKINRGGDITYHGPGQITGYPIFDMECFFTDVHRYVRSIEEAIIRTIAEYGLEGYRIKEYTGVWVESRANTPSVLNQNGDKQRKICAIGVHLSRWVTMHGFAFNVNTDLSLFNNIVPCGIADDDKTVTSLALELGHAVDMEAVKARLRFHFADVFGFEYAQPPFVNHAL